MVVELIHKEAERGRNVSYMIVSEAGASVYSASPLAAEEFPQFDVNLRVCGVHCPAASGSPGGAGEDRAKGHWRWAVSARYAPEAAGRKPWTGGVEDSVNAVGVDVNTASPSLLRRVSGLTAVTAKNIVAYREENGAFTTRKQLGKVPKLGPKAFQQCAGFLRVPESKDILDNTAVHPESYGAAKALLELMGYTLTDVKAGKIRGFNQKNRTLRQGKGCGAAGHRRSHHDGRGR